MIKYVIKPKKNPQTKAITYHPQVAPVTVVNIEQVASRISYATTATLADIQAVLYALEDIMLEELLNGNSLHLGKIGCFRPTLTTKGEDTAEAVTAKNIKKVNVRYCASSYLRTQIKAKQSFAKLEA